ncbi:MAG: hypothetical protein RIB59_12150 [Rhodospirillales bacterium]
MNDDFDRDGLIELLGKLNSDDDEEILKTVKALKAGMKASGKTWDDLIANAPPDSYEADADADEDDVADLDDEDEDDAIEAVPAEDAGDNEEARKIIEKMLSKFQLSAQMREELEDYKRDIAEGEFDARDRQYVKALHARLSKNQ